MVYCKQCDLASTFYCKPTFWFVPHTVWAAVFFWCMGCVRYLSYPGENMRPPLLLALLLPLLFHSA